VVFATSRACGGAKGSVFKSQARTPAGDADEMRSAVNPPSFQVRAPYAAMKVGNELGLGVHPNQTSGRGPLERQLVRVRPGVPEMARVGQRPQRDTSCGASSSVGGRLAEFRLRIRYCTRFWRRRSGSVQFGTPPVNWKVPEARAEGSEPGSSPDGESARLRAV